ncbi:hypothetical protein BIZ37_17925 [Photobacterium sp. BZF1]|uniref:hypothetical protein n=1 Tax=Photobacterium sp. BZF1 TaxID=1904457 RepID=UPI001653BEBE|nr:hypothetical protein [Photobacterium sp. BZF1]MBC7004443.1 hypothetical protein [Photobacterium sp. BZF1]
MRKAIKHNQAAKYTLLLVMVVIFVCSGQNFGFAAACTLNSSTYESEQSVSASIQNHKSSDDPAEQGHCTLADHLLQMHQQSVEHAIVSMFIVVLALLIYAAVTKATPVFTEPIPPTRRRHLTLCVFRE